ncbi:hypothetical protein BGX29_004596 [Mortierella sp. GBA35]|nr:hypothetical protein BGX29_004596 [Mortierella sp. GBA35]
MSLNLTRQYISSAPSTTVTRLAFRPWTPFQPVSRFHLSARVAKGSSEGQQQRAGTVASSASSSSTSRRPQRPKASKPKPDTRRKAQRPNNNTTTAVTPPNNPSTSTSTVTGQVRLNRSMSGKETDQEIIRLVRAGTPWKDIDAALNLPHSTTHHRYYTVLDPQLKVWKLTNGQPNVAMQNRLVYLVEVERQSFSRIERLRLMEEPWKTPTEFAPAEVLEAAGISVPTTAETDADTDNSRTLSTPVASLKADSPKKTSMGPFNRLALQKKYNDIKALATTTLLRENDQLMRRAIQRSVELYGENWKAVATHADYLLDQWLPKPTAGTPTTPPRINLTPTKVASVFRTLQRTGVDWGLEDDVVMARKILSLSRERPDILDILAKSFSEKEKCSGVDQELQRRYWTEISVALGNHSPVQCKRRWTGLWTLQDGDKSAQSKSWHRFERFQYWMLWKYFSQQHRSSIGGGTTAMTTTLTSAEDLQRACEELSYAREISGWMRHRNEDQCDKFFRTSIRSVLNPGQTAQEKQRASTRMIETNTDSISSAPSSHSSPSSPSSLSSPQVRQFESKESLADAITTELADPFLVKMSMISPENKDSTRGDPHQPMVRSEWTPERIRTLNEIIVQEKQGVHRADFELDWDRIAKELEEKYAGAVATTTTDSLVPQPGLLFTPRQCQSCWEYISTTDTRKQPTLTSGTNDSLTKDTTASAITTAGSESKGLQGWSENEVLLLQQGVRRYGTLWADIRAQFLPKKDISDLQRAWFSISGTSTGGVGGQEDGNKGASASAKDENTTVVVDRLSEPDYVGLLSALGKVGGGKSTSSSSDTSGKSE